MALEKYITPRLMRYLNKSGAAVILIVAFGLFLNYFHVINHDNIPIPGLTVVLWIYLLINAGIATPFHYFKEKSGQNIFCPQCGKPLKITSKFSCDECGELEFKKQNQ